MCPSNTWTPWFLISSMLKRASFLNRKKRLNGNRWRHCMNKWGNQRTKLKIIETGNGSKFFILGQRLVLTWKLLISSGLYYQSPELNKKKISSFSAKIKSTHTKGKLSQRRSKFLYSFKLFIRTSRPMYYLDDLI